MAEKTIDPGIVDLKNVRLSFANLFKRDKDRKNDEGETVPGKYGANFLMEKGDETTKANQKRIKAASTAVKKKKYGENESDWPKYKPEKVCLRDGDLEDYDGYAGHLYLSASSDDQPIIVNQKRKAVESERDSQAPYSGCYVNARVRIWPQDNKYGKRINAEVLAVQFLRDGERFGGKAPVDPNEAFEDVSSDDADGFDEEDNEDGDDLV